MFPDIAGIAMSGATALTPLIVLPVGQVADYVMRDRLCARSTGRWLERRWWPVTGPHDGAHMHSHHIARALADARVADLHRATTHTTATAPPRHHRRTLARLGLAATALAPDIQVKKLLVFALSSAALAAAPAALGASSDRGNPNAVPPILRPQSLAELRRAEAQDASAVHYRPPAHTRYSDAEMKVFASEGYVAP
jgi:hypothetical protein